MTELEVKLLRIIEKELYSVSEKVDESKVEKALINIETALNNFVYLIKKDIRQHTPPEIIYRDYNEKYEPEPGW